MDSESVFKFDKVENVLENTSVYLSGPMDFVGSRVIEKYLGWRNILFPILKSLTIRSLDPWNKPNIKGHKDYGLEGILPNKSEYESDFWTNETTRAKFSEDFWETIHVDLRMTDLADFLIAFCPTNTYSVGTVHEIVVAREQHKPVLLVSPPVSYDLFPEINKLPESVKKKLKFYGLKENPSGLPSQWYGNIIGGQNLFDGFGWENMDIKSNNFYDDLFENIINITKPKDDASEHDWEIWKRVEKWVHNFTPVKKIRGGIIEQIEFTNEYERDLFQSEIESEDEKNRKYFWYNKPYVPKRPLLYHFFQIASGYIPPKMKSTMKYDGKGNAVSVSYRVNDDNWLLISQS